MPKDSDQVSTGLRVLVCGGAGYIGSRLVPELISRGHKVRIVDLLWFGNSLPPCDLREMNAADLTERDLEGFDCLIWLAGLSNDPMANFSPAANFTGNASTPAYLAYMARRVGVKRFVHGGSCSVYGYAEDHEHDESSQPSAVYPYGVAKLMAEIGCLQQTSDQFSVIALRKGTVSGYSPRMRFDLIVNTMMRDAISYGVINISHPHIWRPILAIEDAVQAYVKSIEAPMNVSGILNIMSENMTVIDVAGRVAEVVEKGIGKRPKFNVTWKDDMRNYRVSGQAAGDKIGFSPTGTVGSIAAEVYSKIEAEKFVDLMDARYYNIDVFKSLPSDAFESV